MAFIGKTYKHQKDEHFLEFLQSLGIPQEKIDSVLKTTPSQTLEKDGDKYTLTIIDANFNRKKTFESGVEFDEQLAEGIMAKTKITVDGNVVTQVHTLADGRTLTYKREYSGKDLVVVLTTSFWDGFAHRHYVAV